MGATAVAETSQPEVDLQSEDLDAIRFKTPKVEVETEAEAIVEAVLEAIVEA